MHVNASCRREFCSGFVRLVVDISQWVQSQESAFSVYDDEEEAEDPAVDPADDRVADVVPSPPATELKGSVKEPDEPSTETRAASAKARFASSPFQTARVIASPALDWASIASTSASRQTYRSTKGGELGRWVRRPYHRAPPEIHRTTVPLQTRHQCRRPP